MGSITPSGDEQCANMSSAGELSINAAALTTAPPGEHLSQMFAPRGGEVTGRKMKKRKALKK